MSVFSARKSLAYLHGGVSLGLKGFLYCSVLWAQELERLGHRGHRGRRSRNLLLELIESVQALSLVAVRHALNKQLKLLFQ